MNKKWRAKKSEPAITYKNLALFFLKHSRYVCKLFNINSGGPFLHLLTVEYRAKIFGIGYSRRLTNFDRKSEATEKEKKNNLSFMKK